ncbi:protease modulator HflK [Sphingomonas donggukensis]|uniref:Protease modulator HflK n=2 Tax=Sphingomonas donggukensis TaxID=2949093 RepID=A0ABY4TSW0_9SPHN|nr:protease modulator HflK [Sphingomonas donggukensis]URW75367.1 protease modulator HflK [Sphingomonas donggukensis]
MDGWRSRAGAVFNEPPKSPWGGKPGGGGSGGSGSGGGSGGGGNDGPRNPWAFPPEGGRPRHGTSSTLDELLKRAKRGGGPNFTGGSGFPGGGAGMGKLWAIGIALIVALWVVFTSFHSISPQERGVVTFFGKYSGTLEPGIRPTLPAPFNQVTVEDVQNIREENFPASGTGENLMLTRDQNIVDLAYSVRWNIANLQDYVFQIKLPKETVRAAAESAMREVVSSVTLDQALGVGRTVIEARVQERLQQLLDDYNSGVRIQGVAISKADPPAQVNDDFKAVSAAQQQAQADLNNARAYAQQVLARAQGESAQFDKMYEQYKLAPEVTRRRMYYETMEQVLAKSNKTIVEAPGVTPYLPLPDAARRTLPEPSGTTPPAVQQAQPAAGGAQ